MQRARAWLTKWWKFDKDSLKRMGFDAFFTYGFVSNVNAGVTIAAAWYVHRHERHLAAGARPVEAVPMVYIGIYATFGTLLRPSASRSPSGYADVRRLRQARAVLPALPKIEPADQRSLGILVVSLLGNTLVTCAVIYAGITLSALATGVPNFPPGWSFAGFKGAAGKIEEC